MRHAVLAVGLLLWLSPADLLAQTTKLRVAICARTVSMGVGSPFAVAMKMGWFKQEGLEVEIVPLPGSTDCVKAVATGEVPISLPSVEPLANGRPQGVKAKIYYTAYQTNGYGLAVPAESAIRSPAELRGKSIGVTSLASAGVVVARAQVAAAGLDPARDVQIVVAGEGAQTAAMVRNRQVDALSQFDTQYAMVENAGVRVRYLDRRDIERFPGNGFLASEETLKTRGKELIGFARSYAKGTIFTIANPEAAVRIVYEMFPQTKPTGKDEATAVREDIKVLEARMPHYKLEPAGVKRWGESSEANYRDYVDFLVKWNVITQKVPTGDLITNEMIDEINRMDPAKIAAEAAAYRYSR
jgi:NitT/TauT family transport system substrate-binding protein